MKPRYRNKHNVSYKFNVNTGVSIFYRENASSQYAYAYVYAHALCVDLFLMHRFHKYISTEKITPYDPPNISFDTDNK